MQSPDLRGAVHTAHELAKEGVILHFSVLEQQERRLTIYSFSLF